MKKLYVSCVSCLIVLFIMLRRTNMPYCKIWWMIVHKDVCAICVWIIVRIVHVVFIFLCSSVQRLYKRMSDTNETLVSVSFAHIIRVCARSYLAAI